MKSSNGKNLNLRKHIKELIASRKMTQKEVADALGINKQYFNIRLMHEGFVEDNFIKILEVLGILNIPNEVTKLYKTFGIKIPEAGEYLDNIDTSPKLRERVEQYLHLLFELEEAEEMLEEGKNNRAMEPTYKYEVNQKKNTKKIMLQHRHLQYVEFQGSQYLIKEELNEEGTEIESISCVKDTPRGSNVGAVLSYPDDINCFSLAWVIGHIGVKGKKEAYTQEELQTFYDSVEVLIRELDIKCRG